MQHPMAERVCTAIMTGKERVDRSQFFQLSTCEYQLRGHTMKLLKQRTSLDVRKFSFSQRVVQEWNKLYQDVVDATSVSQFKDRLDKFWALEVWLNQPIIRQVQVQVHLQNLQTKLYRSNVVFVFCLRDHYSMTSQFQESIYIALPLYAY